ncbi:hypothetical protein RCL1_006709 [Eukaryota sp. TZLM3-RCL]
MSRRSSSSDKTKEPKTKKASTKTWVEAVSKWEGWKDIYFIGTEWDNYEMIFDVDWDFSNLEHELTEGKLKDKKVFLFGQTEAQLLNGNLTLVPSIIAVECRVKPFNTIVLSSIQSSETTFLPMTNLKIDWVPYVEGDHNLGKKALAKQKMFYLTCSQRKPALNRLPKEKRTSFTYALPFIIIPGRTEEIHEVTSVFVEINLEDKQFDISYDWVHHDINSIIEETMEDYFEDRKDDEEIKNKIKETIETTAEAAKKKNEEERQKREAVWVNKSENAQNALKEAKFYKFYPSGPAEIILDEVKTPFIGRYCPHADEVL